MENYYEGIRVLVKKNSAFACVKDYFWTVYHQKHKLVGFLHTAELIGQNVIPNRYDAVVSDYILLACKIPLENWILVLDNNEILAYTIDKTHTRGFSILIEFH